MPNALTPGHYNVPLFGHLDTIEGCLKLRQLHNPTRVPQILPHPT